MTIDYRRRQLTPGTVWSAYQSQSAPGHAERLAAHTRRIQQHLARCPKDAAGRGRQVTEHGNAAGTAGL